MSSDNGVYILSTIRTNKQEGIAWVKCKPYTVYRVAHVQAIDNFEWYKENDPHNLGAYIVDTWGTSKVYTDKELAFECATKIAEIVPSLEYGIVFIETTLKFYGDL